MQLTLVRHGETVENAAHILQGHLPGTLSERGIEEVWAAAEELKNCQFDAIYSSDLRRCVDTTAIIIKYHTGAPYIEAQELRERSCGEFQGQPNDRDVWNSLPGTYETRKYPGGESWLDVRLRVVPYINKLLHAHMDDNILIVTHGGVVRTILSAFEGKTLESLVLEGTPNAGIWRFSVQDDLPLG